LRQEIGLKSNNREIQYGMSTTTAKAARPRPKHLDLSKIRLPLPGWVSIIHRASGAGLFLALPVLLWLLDMSLTTEVGFEALAGILQMWWVKAALAALVWAYMHHFCAGIRYLLLDMHKCIELPAARASAAVVFFVSIPLAALIAWRLFL
jgi:succinate dehydrogenase / fumarate reductase cytochrome b subunit